MFKYITIFLFVVSFSLLSALGSNLVSGPVTLDTVDPEVELSSPNGGESWYFGDTQNIQWNATDDFLQAQPILIEVSYAGNQNFTILAENYGNSGTYPWLFPEIATNNGYIKVTATDMLGNSTSVYSANSFSLGYVPPKPPSGLVVDISNGIDAILNWDLVTQTIYDTPIVPDGYLILFNETPYENDDNKYYFLGFSPTTNYTHYYAAENCDIFYYTVKTKKTFSARELAMLEEYSAKNRSKPITWQEMKAKLQDQGATK